MLDAQVSLPDEYVDAQPQSSAVNEGEILRQYLPLVKRIVNQLRPHCTATVGIDDMEQLGLMGLLEASRRYGEMDENFPIFASRRIRGSILDELRRRDWRPRQLRQQAHDLMNKVKLLTKKLAREPSEQEILSELGITSDEYHRTLAVSQAEELQSLDTLIQESGEAYSPEVEDEGTQQMIDHNMIVFALGKLPEREQVILSLYYLKELSLKEIAMVVGLTEARVCQLHKSAVKNLQVMIKQQF
ncbi:FliA/WhiG family RNA polymerase sigma factor [Vibrio astriarenae]|uniref:FliA/WhiG family RNA polymerase sigma factor n=1 Tax=Vibrio astriarenae TaxID=1481923 RepID=A0A7Z2T5G5_9VIBR|nr:RNA polymerase sigma factor FliA [Vibrio astriarenae]QIA64522.1 FliA/WhiG family RNA polymerase sigma factor [Vibrio astriarenae]